MSDDDSEQFAEVQRRLSEIQRQKGGRIRWRITHHTAEMALAAIAGDKTASRRSSKTRRRKKHKRLL
jgi:hypothetical protein